MTVPITSDRLFNVCVKCTYPSFCASNRECFFGSAHVPVPVARTVIPVPAEAPALNIVDSLLEQRSVPIKQATLTDVFDLLMAGKKLQLSFQTKTDAESFRTSLYRFKRRTEGQMEDVGIDFDKQALEWHVSGGGHLPVLVAMQLVPKVKTLYTILSVEDAQVPSSMGKT